MTNKKFKKGFGLLEVLISGTVIIIVLSALLVIAKMSLNNSIYLQQRATATYLAQEQIELARQIRDTNWIDGDPTTEWDYFNLRTSCKNDATVNCICVDSDPDILRDKINNYQGVINIYSASAYLAGKTVRPMFANTITTPFITKEELQIRTINNIKYKIATYFTDVGNLLPGDTQTNHNDLAKNAILVNVAISWYPTGHERTLDASEVLTNWRPNF